MALKALEKLRKCAEHESAGFFVNLEQAFGLHRYKCGDSTSKPSGSKILNAIADEIEAEIAERYMLLPVDADGVPIHVGDVMCPAGIREKGHRVIVSAIFEDGFVEYGTENGLIGPLCQEDWVHVNPCTLEDVIAEYEHVACMQEVKSYIKLTDELHTIEREKFSDKPEVELYKEFDGYEFYIELPYDELIIMTDKVEVKHHGFSYMYKHPNGKTTYSCSSLCGYSRDRIIEMLDRSINEVKRELMGGDE